MAYSASPLRARSYTPKTSLLGDLPRGSPARDRSTPRRDQSRRSRSNASTCLATAAAPHFATTPSASLFKDIAQPVEITRSVTGDALGEQQQQMVKGVVLGGLSRESLEVGAMAPRGLMGYECLVNALEQSSYAKGDLPGAPPLAGKSSVEMKEEMAACLSTPVTFEAEAASLRLAHMQQVQRLAIETETALQIRVFQDLSAARTLETAPGEQVGRKSKRLRERMGPQLKLSDSLGETIPEFPAVPKVPELCLPKEEREVISSLFSQDLDDESPRNTLTLDSCDADNCFLSDNQEAPHIAVGHSLELSPDDSRGSLMSSEHSLAPASLDEELLPTLAAQVRAQQAASKLWPDDFTARMIATGRI